MSDKRMIEILIDRMTFDEGLTDGEFRQIEGSLRDAIDYGRSTRPDDYESQDRRRRVFEQVAIRYTTKHWEGYEEQPKDETLMLWAEDTAEQILAASDIFASKVQEK